MKHFYVLIFALFIQHQLHDTPRTPSFDEATWRAWRGGYAAVNRQLAACVAESIEGLVQKALALPKQDYLSIINGQQRIAAEHTYAHKLLNIFKALEIISRWL